MYLRSQSAPGMARGRKLCTCLGLAMFGFNAKVK